MRTTLGTLFLACCLALAGCQTAGKQAKTASRPGGGAPEFVGTPEVPKDGGEGEAGSGAKTASAPRARKGTLAGMVLDPYNRAKPGALVHLVEMGAKDKKAPLQVLVNKAGCFEVQNLPYGKKYQLRAEVREGGRLMTGTTTAAVPSSRVAIYLLQEEAAPAEKGAPESPAPVDDDKEPPASSVPNADAEAGGATPSSTAPPAAVTEGPTKAPSGSPDLIGGLTTPRDKGGELPALPPAANIQGPGRSRKPETRDDAPARFPDVGGLQPSVAPSASPSAAPSADPGTADAREKSTARLVVPSCVRVGNTVHSFALYDKDGKPREYRAPFKTKLVLLDFWYGACGPCRAVIPRLNAWHKKYDGHGLEIVGVSCEPFATTLAQKQQALAKHKVRIDYTELLSGGGKGDCPMVRQMVDGTFPTLVLLDQNGKVLSRLTSSNAAALNRLEWIIYHKLFPDRMTASARRPRP